MWSPWCQACMYGKAKSLGPCGAHGVRRACMERLRVWDHVEPMVSGVHVWEG